MSTCEGTIAREYEGRGPYIVALVNILKCCEKNESITYEELEELINHPIRGDLFSIGIQNSARRILKRDYKMVFKTIKGVGIQRLDDEGIVNLAGSFRDQIRRKARNNIKTLACADYDLLSNEAQTRYNRDISWTAAVIHITKDKAIEKITDHYVSKQLDYSETLKLLGMTPPVEDDNKDPDKDPNL
jgi:hypothetical protein